MPNLRGKRAHRARSCIHADVQRFAKKHRRQFLVDHLAGPVHQVRTHLLEQQLQPNAQQRPDSEDQQCRIAPGGHHTVIDLHAVHRPHQPEKTQQKGGEHRVGEGAAVAANGKHKPVGRRARRLRMPIHRFHLHLQVQQRPSGQFVRRHGQVATVGVFGLAAAIAQTPIQQQ